MALRFLVDFFFLVELLRLAAGWPPAGLDALGTLTNTYVGGGDVAGAVAPGAAVAGGVSADGAGAGAACAG